MRKYQEIWERLKNKEVCKIKDVHPALMKRVIRGVSKEKDEDLMFKQINNDYYFLEITRKPEEGMVIFQLRSRNNLQPVRKIDQSLGMSSSTEKE